MHERYDALVVGAGIIGTACALELATAGLSVGLLDCDVTGGGATASGMGHVVVMDDSPAQCALTRYSQTLWDALAESDRVSTEYVRCGTIWIASDESEADSVRAKSAFYSAHGTPCEVLDSRQLYNIEPSLRPGLAGGLFVPGDSVVYAPRCAALLQQRAVDRGARLLRGTAVRLNADGVCLADGTLVHAGAVVIANGMHALDLLPELPLRAKKGHLAITDRYPGLIHHQLIELSYVAGAHAEGGDSVAFNVQPRSTGQLLIGSSRQFDRCSRGVEHSMLSQMLGRALWYMPALAQLSCIRVWTGIRVTTPDGLPLIGRYPPRPGVWLATGHEGLGITTALGTAKLLAAEMLDRASEIPPEPYLPSRSLAEAHCA